MTSSKPGLAAWLNHLLREFSRSARSRKLSARSDLTAPSPRRDLELDLSTAIACNVTTKMFSGTSEQERKKRISEAVFAQAALSILSRALVQGRMLSELPADNSVQLHDLLDAIHNIPRAIADPCSYFGVHGPGHASLLARLDAYETRWGSRPLRAGLSDTFDTALAGAVDACRAALKCSLLLPGCTPRAKPEIVGWAMAAAARVRESLPGRYLRAHLRAFRWSSHQVLELSFVDHFGHSHAINFTVGHEHTFHLEEPEVPDFPEALHMTGIVIRMLGDSLVVRPTIGDRDVFEQAS